MQPLRPWLAIACWIFVAVASGSWIGLFDVDTRTLAVGLLGLVLATIWLERRSLWPKQRAARRP